MGNSPARTVDVGSVIADTYTLEALIGRGGMGAVFLASHRRLPGKKVAIKLLHAELTDDEVVARFRREALIASQLNHPNIVDVTDFNVTEDGTPYLVLEYLQGESLAQRIKPGPLPLEQVLSIIRQVGSAVAAAHRENIIHRDLKPQNIFLVPKEVDGRLVEIAKVLDFGISKIRGSQTVKTQESTLLGTPQYMAPEQATGQHSIVDERTDLFALGAIVYEMLSGRPAFTGASIPEVVFKVVYEEPAPLDVPGLPLEIVAAVTRAMAKQPDARFPTVSAFVEALTGQPLRQLKTASLTPPEVGFATGSKHRSTGHDAFAQTMGSVDGAPGAITPAPAAAAAAAAAAGSLAQTMPSSPGSPAAAVPTVPAKPSNRQPAATMKRSTVLIAGLALACAAGAGVAVYMVMRSPAASKPGPIAAAPADAAAPPSVDAAVASVPPPADAAVANVPPVDAEVAIVPPVVDAGIRRPTRTPDAAIAPEGPEDEAVKQHLTAAEAALAAGDYARAEQAANRVINSPDARAAQRARAFLVRGTVKCTHQNDQEAAVIDYRNLRAAPALRTKLVQACKSAGIELR